MAELECGSDLSGLQLGCRGPAGVDDIYIGLYPTGYTGTNWISQSGGIVTGITGVTYYKFEVNQDASTATFNPKGANETFYAEHNITMLFSMLTVAARNEVMILGRHPKLSFIVKYSNEEYWMFGMDKGMRMIDSEGTTGTAPGDFRGYTLNFSANEKELPWQVESAVLAANI